MSPLDIGPAEQAVAIEARADRTVVPAPLLCCRCGEAIKAHHNAQVGDGWAWHSKCCNRPPAPCETLAPDAPR